MTLHSYPEDLESCRENGFGYHARRTEQSIEEDDLTDSSARPECWYESLGRVPSESGGGPEDGSWFHLQGHGRGLAGPDPRGLQIV